MRGVFGKTATGIALQCLSAFCLVVPATDGGFAADGPVVGYVFAKASPLRVYEIVGAQPGRETVFEFGKAYAVVEQSPEYVRVWRDDGLGGYVRRANIYFTTTPSWVAASDLFKKADRARIRFWEAVGDVNNYLNGTDAATSQYDFEETFIEPPTFLPRWPVFAVDTTDVIGSNRQVSVAGVLLPITGEMRKLFEASRTSAFRDLELYIVADVSGSTRGYLEPAIAALANAIEADEATRKRLTKVMVGVFGLNIPERARPPEAVTLSRLEGWNRHAAPDSPTAGDVEPLSAALTKAEESPRDSAADLALVVLSGADVDSRGIEDVTLASTPNSFSVFGAITPEPGQSLEDASKRLRGFKGPQYVDFSETIGRDIGNLVIRGADAKEGVTFDAAVVVPMIQAAHRREMMAFMPRELDSNAFLPSPQPYAERADWYTVQLWVVLDGSVVQQVFQ